MNKIIFKCKYFKVRVKEVIIVLALLLLLFLVLSSCEKQEIERKKDEKIENTCVFSNENFNDFNRLLERADLCSEGWFKDLDAYITRLEEQNIRLEKKKGKQYKEVLKYQKAFYEDVKKFKEKQSIEAIDEVEKSFIKYKKYYETYCISEEGKKDEK